MVYTDISVIIPIFNVAEYLKECLDSVLPLTTMLDVEVIMIDDGSTDDSRAIAEDYVAKHRCFRCVHQANAGLGAARNRGVSLANGKYLLFVDSDDFIFADVYARMFLIAEQTGSDITICDSARYKDKQYTRFGPQSLAYRNLTEHVTHISRHHAFMYDNAAWNKLILKSFYSDAGLSFPEGRYYEDMLWSVVLHFRANSVAVMREVGYIYRMRTGNNLSITQRMFERKNMEDKDFQTEQVFAYLQTLVDGTEMLQFAHLCLWTYDYMARFNALPDQPENESAKHLDRFAAFLEKNYDPGIEPMLTVMEKQILRDVFERDLDHLYRVLNYKNINYRKAPVIEKDGTFSIVLPDGLFRIKDRDFTNELERTPPRCFIDGAELSKRALVLNAHVYYRRINMRPGQQQVSAYLFHTVSGKKYALPSEALATPFLTAAKGSVVNNDDYRTYHYNYDGSGVRLTVDFDLLCSAGAEPGIYLLMLEYSNRAFSGAMLLRGCEKSAGKTVRSFIAENDGLKMETDFDVLESVRFSVSELPERTTGEKSPPSVNPDESSPAVPETSIHRKIRSTPANTSVRKTDTPEKSDASDKNAKRNGAVRRAARDSLRKVFAGLFRR